MSPRRLRFLAAVAALVVLGLVVGLVVGLRGSAPVTPVPVDAPAGPIVLVPGYGGSITGLEVLVGRLRATGRDATVLRLPGDGTGDLDAQAAALQTLVVAVLGRTHATSVDLVGYSAGSIVARLYVQEKGGAGRVRRLVTFGAPNHGADLATTASALVPGACQHACAQLEPGSALLRSLNDRALRTAYVSLRTADDQTVRPVDSAVLAGATNVLLQDVCPGVVVSHGQLPTTPLVAGIVIRELSGAGVFAPSAADCAALRSTGS